MSNHRDEFDADKLFARKEQHCGYRYCPLCASPMQERFLDGRPRMVCPGAGCDFIFYQNPTPAAGAIVTRDDSILLVKRAHPPRIGDWCIPAGFMEWHEHPSETAVRELKEETGLTIRVISFFEVYCGNDDPRTNANLMLYLGEILGGTLKAADDALEVEFFPYQSIPANIAFASHRQALAEFHKYHQG